jgi:amidase
MRSEEQTMTTTSRRLRGFLRRPTPDQLRAIGEQEHLDLTPEEAEAYASVLDGVLGTLDRLDELDPGTRPLRWTDRDPGRRPNAEEDPYNAVVRWCRVAGATEGPLAGLHVGIKDNLAVAGVPVTNGSRTATTTPTADAVSVERLLDAGATVVAKCNLDDLSASGTGESAFFAPPRNPHDPTRSAGGSSGGSGSAVASGLVDLALAVDQGGSARIPASFCGVVSHKATHGLIPSHGVTHIDHSIDFVCPVAPSVALTAAATDVLAGHDDRDPQWVRGALDAPGCVDALGAGVAGLRVAVLDEGVAEGLCEPDVVAAFERSVAALADAGATVVSASVPLWSDAWSIELSLLCHLGWAMAQSEGMGWGHLGQVDPARAHAFALTRRLEADDFSPFYKVWLLAGRYLHDEYLSTMYAKAQNLRLALTRQIDAALADADVLVMPTTPHVAPVLLDEPAADTALLQRGTTMVANTAPTNLSGHPSLAVPSGVDRDGLPTSIQLVTRRFADATAFAAGAVVEAAVGRLTPGATRAPGPTDDPVPGLVNDPVNEEEYT